MRGSVPVAMTESPSVLVRGLSVFGALAGPVLLLNFRLDALFPPTSLAIVGSLISANSLNVAIGPNSDFLSTLINAPWFWHLAVKQPANKRSLMNPDFLCRLRR